MSTSNASAPEIGPVSLIQEELAKECALNTNKLHPVGLPRNSVIKQLMTDHTEMTSAVYGRRKETNQTTNLLKHCAIVQTR